jgi:hypothetical protein
MFFLRVILGAWNHVIYTAFFGIGLALARLNRNWFVRILAPLVGWSLAMFTHFMHNTLASFAQDTFGVLALFGTDWLGWFFMFLIIIWAILAERNWIKKNLLEELESGLLTPDQYKMSYSAGALSILRFRAIFAGKYRVTRQYYQLCVELAYKKHQRAKRGEEYSNTVFIEQLRDEISRLGPEAFAG